MIFSGSARENKGELTIEDLQKRIDGAELITDTTTDVLKKHKNGVLIFMGAGDIQKFEAAYVKEVQVAEK